MILRRHVVPCTVLLIAFGALAGAQSADVKQLYEKRATWQESWQAGCGALATLEAEEALERGSIIAPEGVTLGPWHMIGSFSNTDHKQFGTAYPPETETDFDATYGGIKKSEAKWRLGDKLVDGQVVNLHQHFKITEGAICYLHRVLTADKEMDVTLYLGSDDGLAVFLNGKRVHANDVPRGPSPDSDKVNVKLIKGDNELLLKIVNRTGGWGYYFNMTPYKGSDAAPPEHNRRINELWGKVRADFPDDTLAMDWEREDGIWDAFGSHVGDDVLKGRYEAQTTSRLDSAVEKAGWVREGGDRSRGCAELLENGAKTAREIADDSLEARRDRYHGARLVSELADAEYSLVCALLAIDDLSATYPNDYRNADEYDKRARDLFTQADGALKGAYAPGIAELNSKITELKREALVENHPLLQFDDLLFIRRKGHHGLPQNWHGNSSLPRTNYDSTISVLASPAKGGEVTDIFAQKPAFVGDIDLHFGGEKFMFSMAGEEAPHTYQVYEMSADGADLRQVTTSPYPDVDNYDACYVPDGDIIFCSTRSFQAVPCTGPDHVGLLYRANANGEFVRQLTFDQDHSWHPTMMPDGRVLYTRWEYNDTPHYFSRILFAMNPDGTEQQAYYATNSYFPNSIFYSTPIPNSPTRVVSVVSGHHGNPRMGEVAIVDVAQGFKGAEGVVQLLPQRHRKPEELIIDQYATGQWPQFVMPHPLSEKYFIVSCKPSASESWGIYLLDVYDNLVPIHTEAGVNLFEPIPLRPRPLPRVMPSRVDYTRDDAVVRLEDIYSGPGLAGVPRGTIKKLRIVEPIYRYWGNGDHYGVSHDGTWDVKKIWGTVPVHEDGSALFSIPANTPISIQPIDENNMAYQQMRSWFTAMPGEHVACVGCHEARGDAPPQSATMATTHGISPIEPWYGEPRPFRFEDEVQPILDRKCVTCHDADHRVDLRGIEAKRDHKYSIAYSALHPYVRRAGLESDIHLLPPMEFHASTSKLVQMLRKGHQDVELTGEEWDRITTWIDLNVPYHGSWQEVANQVAPDDLVDRREAVRRLDAECRSALAERRGG